MITVSDRLKICFEIDTEVLLENIAKRVEGGQYKCLLCGKYFTRKGILFHVIRKHYDVVRKLLYPKMTFKNVSIVSFREKEYVIERIDRIAEENNLARNSLIKYILAYYIERYKPQRVPVNKPGFYAMKIPIILEGMIRATARDYGVSLSEAVRFYLRKFIEDYNRQGRQLIEKMIREYRESYYTI